MSFEPFISTHYIKEEGLLRTKGKGLRLDAKVSYRGGQAILSVYGFVASVALRTGNGAMRVVLHREFVPRDMPKAEKHAVLRAMCDLIAVTRGEEYYLRSKLK